MYGATWTLPSVKHQGQYNPARKLLSTAAHPELQCRRYPSCTRPWSCHWCNLMSVNTHSKMVSSRTDPRSAKFLLLWSINAASRFPNNAAANDYLIITVKLAQLNSWMIEAENIAVPVLNLIRQLSVKAEWTVSYICVLDDFAQKQSDQQCTEDQRTSG